MEHTVSQIDLLLDLSPNQFLLVLTSLSQALAELVERIVNFFKAAMLNHNP
jgi:hypothetical protein